MADTEIKSVSLRDVKSLGYIEFLRAEWKNAASHFAIIHYSVDHKERNFGVCLDLDKRVFIDAFDVGDNYQIPDAELRDRTEEIWRIVARARQSDPAFFPEPW
jgi:hypothetical protein